MSRSSFFFCVFFQAQSSYALQSPRGAGEIVKASAIAVAQAMIAEVKATTPVQPNAAKK